MSAKSATCITCARPLTPDETVSGICPQCLYRAASLPHLDDPGEVETNTLTSNWSDAFPQFEGQQILIKEAGFFMMKGSLVSDEFASGHGPGALMIWSGAALAAEGGEDLLLARIDALRLTPRPGLAPIVDAGDLHGRVYAFAKLPAAGTPWTDAGMGEKQNSKGAELSALLPALARLTASVRASCGIDLDLDPALLFRDAGGEPFLVPRPIRPDHPGTGRDSSRDPAARAPSPGPGTEIGPYTLVAHIGEGGFGEVWQARQERPATRLVALKILKHGLTSPRIRARFEVEQQALARLDHANVARFFDGGITPDGRPFFAMEWIAGSTLTDHCQSAQPALPERLHLFDQVCEAVQHAHRKGIIHRDLKPSNVMISSERAEPAVKVIDFGIAKALEEPLTDRTLLTRAEEIVGTPVSMSPEQAAGLGGAELDARTDVYGLGILLYQLLCDARPFDESLAPEELRRCIREDDPPRPSSRVTDAHRRRALLGDLDWIVMRCLEKEPERRYQSVAALADDLKRHTRNEPVTAGPPEFTYRARKFIRRHRAGLAVSGIVAAALVAGLAAALFGLTTARREQSNAVAASRRASNEAAVSEAVNRFLTEELLTLGASEGLTVSDPRNHDIRLRTVLERAAARIDDRFDATPEVEAALRRAIAASFFATGEFEKAGNHAQRAAVLYESTLGEDDPRTLEMLRLLASVRTSQGKVADAHKILHRIVHITGERGGGVPETRSKAEFYIANADLWFETGDPYAAAGGYLQAAMSGKLPPRLQARALSGFARGREGCEPRSTVLNDHRKAVAFAEKTFGRDDALTLEIMRRYARLLADASVSTPEEITRGVPLLKDVIKRQTSLLGRTHPDTLRSRFDLALAFGALDVLAPGSLKEIEEIVAAAAAHYPDDHPEVLRFQLGWATQLGRGDEHQRAIEVLEGIIEGGKRSVGESHPVVVDATRQLGEELLEQGRKDEALAQFRRAATRAREGLPATTPARQDAVLALGTHIWMATSNGMPEALEHFHTEYRACSELLGRDHRLSAGYLDRVLGMVEHDRTGGLAVAAAERAMQTGGTPAPTIRSLLQLSLASQLCLRPSIFLHPTPPLPEAYYRLLEVESMDHADTPKTEMPPELVAPTAEWRFIVLGEGDAPPLGWEGASFDDDAWRSGSAPLGFGEAEVATDLQAGRAAGNQVVGACFRHRFTATSLSDAKPSLLRLRCDDGAVVCLNGTEIARFNLPDGGPPDRDTRARHAIEARTRDFLIPAGHLVRGENVLAARVFSHSVSASAVLFSTTLRADVSPPMERLVQFDPEPALAHLEEWVPGLAAPLEKDWSAQAACMQVAMLGRWREALAQCNDLSPGSGEAATRQRWFRQNALKRLGRPGDAAALFRDAIPARDPSAPPELIDLTAHYNTLVTEPWHLLVDGLGYEPILKEFPTATGTFDGITFDARGIVQLMSNGFEELNPFREYPRSVDGIAIGRKIDKLHFLNATLLPDVRDEVVANVVLHYADGSEETFPLRYWHETLNCMVGTDAPPAEVRSGWRGTDLYRPGMFKEFFIATWENPRPEVMVTSIDLHAEENAGAALMLLAITSEPLEAGTADE